MRNSLEYIFVHFYLIALKLNKATPKESAVIYISIMICFVTFPLIFGLIFYFFKRHSFFIFLIPSLLNMYLAYNFTNRYFKNTISNDLNRIIEMKTKKDKIIGMIVVSFAFLVSFFLFFVVLNMF